MIATKLLVDFARFPPTPAFVGLIRPSDTYSCPAELKGSQS